MIEVLIDEDGTHYINKGCSDLMMVITILLRMVGLDDFPHYWTTIRLPFGPPTIYVPIHVTVPWSAKYDGILDHERLHVAQQSTPLGLLWSYFAYLIFPLPVLFSGRWFIERGPWLAAIIAGRWTVEQAVETLWRGYFFPWPRFLMREWFKQRLHSSDGGYL